MAETMDRVRYEEFIRAKQLLSRAGYANITRDQYMSMQTRILTLEKEVNAFYQVAKKCLDFLIKIMDSINKNNSLYTDEGAFCLSSDESKEITELCTVLTEIDGHNQPLIED